MSDTVYSDGSLQLTEREIITPKRSYPLADVKSTSIAPVPIGSPERERWQFLFYWLLYSLAHGSSENPDLWRFEIPLGEAGRSMHIGSGYLFLLLILAARAFLTYRGFFQTSAHVYIAKVAGSFGKVVIAAATRRDQMQELINTINSALGRDRWDDAELSEEAAAKPIVVPFTQAASGEIQSMVWVDGKIYDTRDIKLVEKASTTTHPRVILINLAADVATLCIFIAFVWTQAIPKDFSFAGILVLLLLMTPVILSSAYLDKNRWPVVHLVKLKTSAGTEYPFASLSAERVQEVVDYISISLPYGPKSGYITDSEVQIDDTKARFGKKIYAVEDIKAVDVQMIRSNSRELRWFGSLAVALATSLIALDFYLSYDPVHWLALLTAPLLILPGVILILVSKKTTYTLTLQGRFGEVQAFNSHSERYVGKIATILRGVLMRRGETLEMQT